MSVELTPEQKQLLAQCEADFADRYTENDPDYMKAAACSNTPPIVHPWYTHAKRNYDWSNNRRDRDGDRHGRDRWRGKSHRRDDHRSQHRNQPYHWQR